MKEEEPHCPFSTLSGVTAFFNALPLPVAAFSMNEGSPACLVNEAFTKVFGYRADEIREFDAWAERVFPDQGYRATAMTRLWEDFERLGTNAHASRRSDYEMVDRSGLTQSVSVRLALYEEFILMMLGGSDRPRSLDGSEVSETGDTGQTALMLTENILGGAYTMVLDPGQEMAWFSFISTAALKILNLDRDAVVADAMKVFACVHPEDFEQWISWHTDAFRNKAPFSHETRVIVHGEVRWIRSESVPRILENGSVIWDGVVVDITQLKNSEAQLKSVLKAAQAYTWRRDLKAGVVEFDSPWGADAGHWPGERIITGDDWLRRVHDDDVEEVSRTIEAMEAGSLDSSILNYRRRAASNEWVWLQVHSGISERDETGKPTAISGVSFDITNDMTRQLHAHEQEAELREELQRAHQRDVVAEIAGSMAHDLNNLLGVILWSIEQLELLETYRQESGDSVARMREAVDMALDLVAGLRNAMNVEYSSAELDLKSLFRSVPDLIGPARLQRHRVRVLEPAESSTVHVNRTAILQVIQNLAMNACDSGTEKNPATVTIRVLPRGTDFPDRDPDAGAKIQRGTDVVIFKVIDTGLGISDHVRRHMFERDFTTKGPNGTGLGLRIVARILRDHGASLWADTILGKGTTMTVAWPTTPDEELNPTRFMSQGEEYRGGSVDPTSLKGVLAMVVDDLPDVARALSSMLKTAGAAVFCETDPEFLKEILSESPKDWSVLVTDLHMPNVDGLTLARFAASLSPPIPVVLVTARPDMLDDRSRENFAAILPKPVTGVQLVDAVRQVVDAQQTGPQETQ